MRKYIYTFTSISVVMVTTIIVLLSSCNKDLNNNNQNPVTNLDLEKVIAGVRGIVIDENNQPVMGATVTSGTNTTTTDHYGVFVFSNISLSKANGYVKVTKSGYFTGSRTFVTTAGRIHNVRIRLLPKTNTGNFSAATGGTIALSGGAKLVVPATAIADASGNAYTGTVNVAMTWIDPTAPNLPEIIPGDLRGLTTSGEERGLRTYGMLGVELTNAGGQKLQIASGKSAELTFPIPGSIAANAPATIDLWNFDEATGRWKQEGQATKNGNNYKAQISHFSFWNVGAPFPVINLCMTLFNASNSQPLINVLVRIRRVNGEYGYGWTDSLGNICGKVPLNEPLVMEVVDQCYVVVYSQNIGPFANDVLLGTISVSIPPAQSLTITGTVTNCAGGNVTNGAAFIYTNNVYYYTVLVTNGTFSCTILRCSNSTINFSVLGVDFSTLQQSAPVNGSGTSGTINVGTIQACGTSSVQFIEYIIDGTPRVISTDIGTNVINNPQPGPYSNFTMIVATPIPNFFQLNFDSNLFPGIYPITDLQILEFNGLTLSQITSVNPVVNISTFGPPLTGFIEGNFNIQMNFGGTTKNVICNFRVRRN